MSDLDSTTASAAGIRPQQVSDAPEKVVTYDPTKIGSSPPLSEEEDGEELVIDDDFVEFHLNGTRNHPHAVEVVTRDIGKVEESYKQEQQPELSEVDDSAETAVSSEATSVLADVTDHNNDDDDWKEMQTCVESADIYDIRGEAIEVLFNGETTTVEPPVKHSAWSQLLGRSESPDTVNNSTVSVGTKPKRGTTVDSMTSSMNASSTTLGKSGANGVNNTSSTDYTRVSIQEQATKFNEMDRQFEFLFGKENDNLKKLHASESNLLNGISPDNIEAIFDEFDNAKTTEGELTVGSQLLTTRSMLDGSQKIAYAALAKLTIVEQHVKLNDICESGSLDVMKKIAGSQRSFTRWSMNVMDDLYDHLGISDPKEKQMIETLSCHGIEPDDLVSFFNTDLVVKNDLNTSDDDLILAGDPEEEKEENLDIDIRWTIICDLFLILLESSIYDARSRTMMLHFANYLGIKNLEVYQFERRITGALEMEEITAIVNSQQGWNEKDILKEHRKKRRGNKMVKVAFATVAGGLVIGLSAGALAPVIGAGVAAGFSTIGIGGTAGVFAGTAGTSLITTGGVLTGMRIGQKGMGNRAGSVKTFEFKPLHNNGRLNLILTISGWMSGTADDVRLPFSTVDSVMGDLYSLLWEPEMLTSMGQTLGILANEVLTQSIQQILGATILTTLMAGIALPNWLAKLSYLIDNPWSVSLNRAEAAGHILADVLRRNRLGVRPITLVSFSLGSLMVWTCLQDLVKTGDYGLIENVYMFGAPVVVNKDSVVAVRSAVSGRFVNGYSQKDWILGYLFRATSGGLRTVAGLSEIEGLENINCTEYVAGHMEYRKQMPKLLKMLDWEVISEEFVEIEEPDAETATRQRKLISDFEKAQAQDKEGASNGKSKKHKKTWYGKIFGGNSKKNKEWWEMYEKSTQEQQEKIKELKEGDKDLFDVSELAKEVANIEGMAKDIPEPKTPKLGKETDLKPFRTPKSDKRISSGFSLNVVDTKSETSSPSVQGSASPPPDDGGMRPLRVGKGAVGHRSPSLNLNAVAGRGIANLAIEGSTKEEKVVEEEEEEEEEESIDPYGTAFPEEEHIEICFDDDFDRVTEEIQQKASENFTT